MKVSCQWFSSFTSESIGEHGKNVPATSLGVGMKHFHEKIYGIQGLRGFVFSGRVLEGSVVCVGSFQMGSTEGPSGCAPLLSAFVPVQERCPSVFEGHISLTLCRRCQTDTV